jgi:hypothetical protein
MPCTILDADTTRGIPTRARCDDCGATWERPEWDLHADTLPIWAQGHENGGA